MADHETLRRGFSLGPWQVLPDRGLLRRGDAEQHVEPLVMNVLVALAERGGEVATREWLLEAVWPHRVMTDEPLNRCISLLRRQLGDDSRNPTYIENIPRVGYRLIVPVELPAGPAASGPDAGGRMPRPLVAAVIVIVAIGAGLGLREWLSPSPQPGPVSSVAVFHFSCAAGTADFLCFGFSEQLTSTLLEAGTATVVKLPDPYPPSPPGLDVDALLFGQVQQVGGQLRIAAEAHDTRDGRVLALKTFDGSIGDLFALQEQVATWFERQIRGDDTATLLSSSRPAQSEAFIAYAQGLYQFERRSRASIEESIRLFEETIRVDPAFGPAYLRLAYALLLLPEYDGALSVADMYDRAAAITSEGIGADPGIEGPAATVFGFIHHKRGEWLDAHAAFGRAISADTVYPLTHNWYSRFLATVGRMDEARSQAERAYLLAPQNPTNASRLAITHFWIGDLETAAQYFDIANKLGQESPIHDLAYSMFLIRTGDVDAARQSARAGLVEYGFDASWVDPVFDGVGDPALRDAAIEIVAELEQEGELARYIVMSLWAVLDAPDRAMATAFTLEGIGQDFETGLEVMFSNELRALHALPDFPRLLELYGLSAYWRQIGCDWSRGGLDCP